MQEATAESYETYVIQPPLGTFFPQGDPNQGTWTECLQCLIDGLRRLETDIVHSMSAVSLGLDDVPEFAIGAGQDAAIGRLSSPLGKDDRVVQDDLDERRVRRRGCLLLLALPSIGWRCGQLGLAAAYGRCGQLSKQRVTCERRSASETWSGSPSREELERNLTLTGEQPDRDRRERIGGHNKRRGDDPVVRGRGGPRRAESRGRCCHCGGRLRNMRL